MIKDLWIKCKRFILPYPLAYTAKYTLRLILWTCRFEIRGLEEFLDCAKNKRCILSLWHNRLALVPEVMHRFTEGLTFNAVISKSRDGEPLAILVDSYKEGKTTRVAHNDRHGALRHLIQYVKQSTDILVITPDGPRGPCYQVKPGVIMAAKSSGASIVLFSWTARGFWRLKTWDGFMLPKPFSTIEVSFSKPLVLPSETTVDEDAVFLQGYFQQLD